MSSDIAISVEGLSKCYLVGHNAKASADNTLRDQIVRHARNLARKSRDMASGRVIVQGDTVEEFWALRDVSFEIPRGARVGILGRNGAGKSTLLKLLSRITEPTNGRIKINGRVASLLEVGTGFHPELSGRENIFLNGAILGMSRREVQSKFDEIVEFAEVERFLDTPVKRYSSGMYVRLAFAVAAHLEPEILIVDEVLAVGDAQFQQKCLGKMRTVGQAGRTVIFVSHNLGAINQLCDSAAYLRAGNLVDLGPVGAIIPQYINYNRTEGGYREWSKGAGSDVLLHSVETLDATGKRATDFGILDEVTVLIHVTAERPVPEARIGFRVLSSEGNVVFSSDDREILSSSPVEKAGAYVLRATIPGNVLNDGSFTVSVVAHIPNVRFLFHEDNVLPLRMHTKELPGFKRLGYIRPPVHWQVLPEVHVDGIAADAAGPT